jgi:hypothetical protein
MIEIVVALGRVRKGEVWRRKETLSMERFDDWFDKVPSEENIV